MTPEQKKLAYELVTNPPPGSKLAEAKAHGVDLMLLYENLQLTPTERAQAFSASVNYIQRLRAAGIEVNTEDYLTRKDLDRLRKETGIE